MADTLNTTPILSVIATNASRLSDLSIINGQLIFIKDKGRIALDGDILENSAKGIETPVRFGETIGFVAFSH